MKYLILLLALSACTVCRPDAKTEREYLSMADLYCRFTEGFYTETTTIEQIDSLDSVICRYYEDNNYRISKETHIWVLDQQHLCDKAACIELMTAHSTNPKNQ